MHRPEFELPVFASQAALPGLGQERQPVAVDVCEVEHLYGAQTNIAGGVGMSAPAALAKARTQGLLSPKPWKLGVNSTLLQDVNIHVSARALAGVMKAIPEN